VSDSFYYSYIFATLLAIEYVGGPDAHFRRCCRVLKITSRPQLWVKIGWIV